MSAMNNAVVQEQEMENADPVLTFVGQLTTTKLSHANLILNGVCTGCAHCGQKLTDSASIERGIGPVCSKKGYLEDPKDGDEMGAMLALAEYPTICQFLVANYRQNGNRSLMNGIVKIASLNRGNHELHTACTEAVEALGYTRLANALRESISVIELKKNDEGTDLDIWVKKYAFSWAWYNDLKKLEGLRFVRYPKKRYTLRVKNLDGTSVVIDFEGKKITAKNALAILMARHYKNLCGRVVGGSGFKIDEKWVERF